ncbi:MAG: FAD-binding oxidoreductase [Planctomycetes bacterium]|nr:FAD-binding oxidoreductase [Planctomycetota bacterium]
MGETRDVLESEIGARAVGTAVIDEREVPVAFANSEADVVRLLTLAASRNWRVTPIGSGTKIDRGVPREKPRFAISLRGYSGVTAYERGDGTLTARAGSTMAALAQVARSGGNHLTPDVARAAHATLGGTIASGISGIDRLRYGPLRNHVLGLRVALGDGSVVKSGGKLVKNVTGFDLHRLYTGSRGSLCVILEASLRLFNLPEREIALQTVFFGRAAALASARVVLASQVKPTCVAITGALDSAWTLSIALAGRADVLVWEEGLVRDAIGTFDRFEGELARAKIEELRDREAEASVHAACLPGGLESALARVDEISAHDDHAPHMFIHPGIASLAVEATEPTLPAHAAALTAARARVELAHASVSTRGAFDPLAGVAPPVRRLMTDVTRALDPVRRFAGPRAMGAV